MRTIWKFPIDVADVQTIQAPTDTKWLTAQFQGEQLCLWGEVDNQAPLMPYYIAVYGTGHPLEDSEYIATVQDPRAIAVGASLIWHIYAHTV